MAVGGIVLDPSYGGSARRLKLLALRRPLPFEVNGMFENLNGHTHAATGWTATLYDYARWEYGSEDAAIWLLAEARRRTRRASVVARLIAWLLPPRAQSVARVPRERPT